MKIVTIAIIASVAMILLVHAMQIGAAIAIALHPHIATSLHTIAWLSR